MENWGLEALQSCQHLSQPNECNGPYCTHRTFFVTRVKITKSITERSTAAVIRTIETWCRKLLQPGASRLGAILWGICPPKERSTDIWNPLLMIGRCRVTWLKRAIFFFWTPKRHTCSSEMIFKTYFFLAICMTETDGLPATCCKYSRVLNSFNVGGIYCRLQIVVWLRVRTLVWQWIFLNWNQCAALGNMSGLRGGWLTTGIN